MLTILGSTGFVGAALAAEAGRRKLDIQCPARNEELTGRDLGTVIYTIGLTADFRTRLLDTVEAHVAKLERLLRNNRCDSVVYTSSARIYGRGEAGTAETTDIKVQPTSTDHLYNISKLMGESLMLAVAPRPRVVRLANVYGADLRSANFLTEVIASGLHTGKVVLRSAWDSEKDFVAIDDVVSLILDIATRGQQTIYNVASGLNVSNREIGDLLQRHLGCAVEVAPGSPSIRFAPLDVGRIAGEFGFKPRKLADEFPALLAAYRQGQAG